MTIEPDEGKVLSKVVFNIDVKNEQEKSVTIVDNGTVVDIFPDDNKTLSKVTINTNIPVKEEQEKSVTWINEDDISITPDDNHLLSKVNISVNLGYNDKLNAIETLIGGETAWVLL